MKAKGDVSGPEGGRDSGRRLDGRGEAEKVGFCKSEEMEQGWPANRGGEGGRGDGAPLLNFTCVKSLRDREERE